MPVGKWATVAEATRELGVTRQRVHQLIQRDLLGETRQVKTPRGPVWLIRWPIQRIVRRSGQHRDECTCGKHPGDRGISGG